jgi:hypothetical protein
MLQCPRTQHYKGKKKKKNRQSWRPLWLAESERDIRHHTISLITTPHISLMHSAPYQPPLGTPCVENSLSDKIIYAELHSLESTLSACIPSPWSRYTGKVTQIHNVTKAAN